MEKSSLSDRALEGWGSHPDLYQILKKLTTGDATQAVMGAASDNGLEAWRRFIIQYELANAIKHRQQLFELPALGHKRCKSPQGTSIFLLARKENSRSSGD